MNHSASANFRRLPLHVAIGLALAACAVGQTQAATVTFNGNGGSSWSNPRSWVGGLVPVNGDDVWVASADAASKTANFSSLMTGAGLNSLNLDYGATLNQNLAGSVMIANTETIGSYQAQTSTYNQAGGSNTTGRLFVGGEGSGVYNLSGGTLKVGTDVDIGWCCGSTGAFNQSGGTTTVEGNFRAGYSDDVTGTVTLKAGNFSVRELTTIGVFGTGSFTQSGGSATLGGLVLGYQENREGKGSYILNSNDGAASLSSSWVDIGVGGGSSSFTQSGNTSHQVAGELRVGKAGSYTLNGGTLSADTLKIEAGGVVTFTAGQLQLSSLQLAGGTLTGSGQLFNTAELSGYGRIDGTGGFINTGLLTQSGGDLLLSNSGDNENRGSWNLLAGRQLDISVGLENNGQLNLNGGAVVGSGMLANATQGVISGSGRIASGFYNQGSLVVDSGRTQIDKNFINQGQILLGGNSASLAGGEIGNQGLIQGLGKISNNISNVYLRYSVGVIEAQGGTLTLTGRFISPNTGILAVGSGAKLVISQGLNTNAGQIQLAGGTLDNNGHIFDNEAGASINGFGTLRANAVLNQGQIFLSGGNSALRADIITGEGGQIILSGLSNSTFYGRVELEAGAELRVTEGSVATFAAVVQQRSGSDVNGGGKMFFEGGLELGNSPGYGYIEGTVTFSSSNTYTAEIGGVNACTTLSCATGAALVNDSFDKLEIGGNFQMGGKLVLTSWNGFVAQAGQSFDLLDWGTLSGTLSGTGTGTFKSIDASGFMLAAGTQLDYSQLYSSGTISVTAVPEPTTLALWLAGLAAVGGVTRRRRTPDTSAKAAKAG